MPAAVRGSAWFCHSRYRFRQSEMPSSIRLPNKKAHPDGWALRCHSSTLHRHLCGDMQGNNDNSLPTEGAEINRNTRIKSRNSDQSIGLTGWSSGLASSLPTPSRYRSVASCGFVGITAAGAAEELYWNTHLLPDVLTERQKPVCLSFIL